MRDCTKILNAVVVTNAVYVIHFESRVEIPVVDRPYQTMFRIAFT